MRQETVAHKGGHSTTQRVATQHHCAVAAVQTCHQGVDGHRLGPFHDAVVHSSRSARQLSVGQVTPSLQVVHPVLRRLAAHESHVDLGVRGITCTSPAASTHARGRKGALEHGGELTSSVARTLVVAVRCCQRGAILQAGCLRKLRHWHKLAGDVGTCSITAQVHVSGIQRRSESAPCLTLQVVREIAVGHRSTRLAHFMQIRTRSHGTRESLMLGKQRYLNQKRHALATATQQFAFCVRNLDDQFTNLPQLRKEL